MPKLSIGQVFLSPKLINDVVNYSEANRIPTISQAVAEIILEWQRFRTIALKLQAQAEQEQKDKLEVKKDEKIDKISKSNKKKKH